MVSREKIYLDYAATTPVAPVVLRAMQPYFSEKFGNAGSLHSFGQEAMAAVDRSREIVAGSIGAAFQNIVFTGSATEANNLVFRGVVARSKIPAPKIIVTTIEHESILETARNLESSGAAQIVYIPVDHYGIIDISRLKKELDERTILVSVMYANNEIGAIQPIREIAKIIRDAGKFGILPLFHTDAAQAFQFLDCATSELEIDLMTLSSHKIYGPKRRRGALYKTGRG